jgi:hypothetical protein
MPLKKTYSSSCTLAFVHGKVKMKGKHCVVSEIIGSI